MPSPEAQPGGPEAIYVCFKAYKCTMEHVGNHRGTTELAQQEGAIRDHKTLEVSPGLRPLLSGMALLQWEEDLLDTGTTSKKGQFFDSLLAKVPKPKDKDK